MDIIQTLAQELDKAPQHVENVVRLLDEGNTIPFIARYRKELHGAMDDTSLRTLEERLQYLRGLEERREAVKRSIDEQGKLTDELAAAIDSAKTLAEVEDLYRPYKQKRRTRATAAKEKGLEPLAALLFGFFRALGNVYTGFAFLKALNVPSSVYNMLPYIISLIVLAFTSKSSRAPKAEGIPYDKGQR